MRRSDFFEALVGRNQQAARVAYALFARYQRPERQPSGAEKTKRQERTAVLAQWVVALRERRDEELRGVLRRAPTAEAQREGCGQGRPVQALAQR